MDHDFSMLHKIGPKAAPFLPHPKTSQLNEIASLRLPFRAAFSHDEDWTSQPFL